MSGESGSDFNETRAEIFEALGHPTRIRILQAVSQRPLGFSELKKEVGIESSGHLAFHLGKLGHLVKTDQMGLYGLTDDGREALRIVEISRTDVVPRSRRRWPLSLPHAKVLVACLLVAVIVLSSVAVIQQEQIGSFERNENVGTTVIDAQRYWYLAISAPLDNGSAILFHGVGFTLINPPTKEAGPYTITFKVASVSNYTAGVGLVVINGSSEGLVFKVVLSEVQVRFPDGTEQNDTGLLGSVGSGATTPWFSQNESPKVVILWDPGNATLDYCVAMTDPAY